jgi:hypothetical protein
MFSRTKATVAALAAVVAVGATMASAAHAGEFTAENYAATVTGTALAKHQFQFNGGAISCTVASFDGKLAGPAENITIAAEYGNCSTPGGAAVTVNMTGCDYAFHAGATLENDRVEGSMEVQCAQGGEGIDIEEAGGCMVRILPQAGLGNMVYTNHTEAKDFDIDFNIGGIAYVQNAACPMGEGVFANGTYMGQSTMTGESAAGADGLKVD